MRVNPKSQKGAVTLMVLITMLFLMAFLMSLYVITSNKAQTSTETTKEIAKKYNNIGEADTIYNSYFATEDIIPIYNVEQLKKIGSSEQIEIDGKIYTFLPNANYILKNDLNLGGYYDTTAEKWTATEENIWEPLPLGNYTFTGVLDGLGHTITGLYLNNEYEEQGLFGNLTGTIKNITIKDSFIGGKNYVGAIAGKNSGTIENCHNKAIVIGEDYVGGIAGNLSEDLINCSNTGNIIGDTNVTGGYFKSIETGDTIEVWSNNVLEENAYFVSGNYTATAPKGFKVSKNIFEQTIEDGMVVQDVEENEFVWVPVKVTSTDTSKKIASFYRSEWANNERNTALTNSTAYIEPYTGNEWEVTDYNNMVASVYDNKGFYIGRFEAGTTEARTKKSNGTTDMVVKRDSYPYIYVTWGESDYTKEMTDEYGFEQGYGAVYLSKSMYDGKDFGVSSTLCYSIQWDAILDFIKDENHNVNQNNNWGNTKNYLWTINRKTAEFSMDFGETWDKVIGDEIKKETGETILLTTGADESFKSKNIYDINGNIFELTNEIRDNGLRVPRGNNYLDDYDGPKASYRASYFYYGSSSFLGFRPALYVK